MSTLSQEELKSVMTEGHGPAISVFLPTHRAGPDIQQDPIRLKNLLKQAETQLINQGIRATEARDLLAPLSALLDDAGFWRHQGDGLAMFRSREVFRVYRLPISLEEFVQVSDRFYVKPLLPVLINESRFYVLALSQKAVRLLECSRDHIQAVDLPAVPQGMEAALLAGTSPQDQHYSLPLGPNTSTRFHGHGAGTDDLDAVNVTRYFHRVTEGLKDVLKHNRAPIVLACVEYLAPLFKEASGDRHILEPMVRGNPDGLSDKELHQRAWPLAEPYFMEARSVAAAQYHEGLAKGRAGHSLLDVLTAAHQGKVATLFIPLGVHRYGRFHFDSLSMEEHAEEQPGDDELIDLAAMQTLLHAGVVYGTEPKDIPGQQLLAAVYRF
jgi:Bacterial archaeo-eukaryotic release factor family 7